LINPAVFGAAWMHMRNMAAYVETVVEKRRAWWTPIDEEHIKSWLDEYEEAQGHRPTCTNSRTGQHVR